MERAALDDRVTPFAVANFRGQDTPFGIRRRDRRFHTYILGRSGTGKSSLLETLVRHDLAAGEGLLLIDPHGDLVARVKEAVPPTRRSDLLHLDAASPENGINPLEYTPPAFQSLAASGFVSSLRTIWADSWGPRLEHILRNCALALIARSGSTVADIPRLLGDAAFRRESTDGLDNANVKSFWLHEYESYPERLRADAIAPIQNKIGALLSEPVTSRVLTGTLPPLRLRQVMDEGKVLLVDLAKGRIGEDASSLLGSLLLSRVMLAATSRVSVPEENRRDFYVYADEVHSYATGNLAESLAELRKFRANFILSHQHLSQLPEAVRNSVIGNVGTLIAFRLGVRDAEELAPEFNPPFTARDIVSLPNYHIYLRLMIDGRVSAPFSARTPPPAHTT